MEIAPEKLDPRALSQVPNQFRIILNLGGLKDPPKSAKPKSIDFGAADRFHVGRCFLRNMNSKAAEEIGKANYLRSLIGKAKE